MSIFSNPIVAYALFGCSFLALIGFSFLLIRISLRDQAKALLRERLDSVKTKPLSAVEPSTILLSRAPRVEPEKTNKLTDFFSTRFGIKLKPGFLIAIIASLASLVFASFAFYLVLGTFLGFIVSVSILSISVGVLWAFKFRRDRFLGRCEAQLPEVMDFIVRALKAGHAFPSSVSLAGQELPAPLGPELGRAFKEQELGIPLSTSLVNLTKRIPTMDLKYFVAAYQVNKELGGNLAEVYENISKIIRERFKLRRHVQAITAEGRWSAWVLALLPIGTAGVIFILRPEHLRILLREPVGHKLIIIAMIMWLTGVIVIRRLIRIDY